jgi:hypothetical protein
MSAQITGMNELDQRLKMYLAAVKNPKEKTAILAAGGAKIRQKAAKSPTPKSQKNHFYYSKSGKVEIQSGNLQKSMKVFRGKDGDVYVGPRVLRRITGTKIGDTAKTASGYYAHMLYKSAGGFRQKVMEPAAVAASGATFKAIEKAFTKFHIRQPIAQ